ncbi:MAG: hypothetical protein A2Y07_10955 [Planctomycetes bacterium GWF2_50_10]|nr:MAG: hypothetical protein A2Y07_10955 [Planctomycetes bacterium GWF2_50_10]
MLLYSRPKITNTPLCKSNPNPQVNFRPCKRDIVKPEIKICNIQKINEKRVFQYQVLCLILRP